MDAPNRRPERVIFTIISIGFVIWSVAFIYKSSFIAIDGRRYFCLFDDAMVSMRYAWNFSHGIGLIWNPGERVQGYTNLLMTLLMSLATLIFDKSSAVLMIQILGIGFVLAIGFAGMKIASHLIQDDENTRGNQTFLKILSFFGILFYYPLIYWSLMGMETGLLALLLLLSILSAFDYEGNRNLFSLFLTSGYLGLAYLTRNDSIIFAVLIWSYIIWQIPNKRINFKNLFRILSSICSYFIFVIGQFVFQYLYYGEWEPNTYTLKLTGMPLMARLANGIGFIKLFLLEISILLILSLVDMIFKFRKRKLLLLSLVLSAIAYQVYVGGDSWNYWRIMSPTIPLLIILFIIAINSIVLTLNSAQPFRVIFYTSNSFRRNITQILSVSLTLIGLLSANVRFLGEISFLNGPYQASDNQNNVNTAIALSQLTTNDATVGVYWAGSIPYFTGRKAVDFLGKSDQYIAHLPPDMSGNISRYGMNSVPGHNKYDLNYSIKDLSPTYVQGFVYGLQDLSQWAKTKYVRVEYNGVSLFLLKNSPSVLWGKIGAP
jgi:arabinofuranosyltransferase